MFTDISLYPFLIIIHCIFIFLFKRWLGAVGTFYSSIIIFFITIYITFRELLYNIGNGNFFYIDNGRFFFCLDLIDSHLIFCFDNLALISAMLVLILTTLALYFGIEYMYRDAFINRLLYLLNLFATSVIFLFFSYDFFLIILCWECIGLFSLLLVNFYSIRIYTIKAALKTFIFSRISDTFMFLSFILVIVFFNTTELSLIFLQIPFLNFHYCFIGNTAIHFLSFFGFCIVTTGVIKAAQFFFHVWLPDAMEAPTPASALIHSSTLVVAGVFLIIRFSVLFEFTIAIDYFLAFLGCITLLFGAVTAIFQHDIKKLVAYSTISQIGYLVCGCGFCCFDETFLYLIIHALNKAFLFILVGYLVHFFNGNTDMRRMGGVYLYSFDISILLFTVAFNLAGLPYGAGFIGKEFLLFQLFHSDFFSYFVRNCWILSFFFTPFYMYILTFYVMFGYKKSSFSTFFTYWKFSKAIFSYNHLRLFKHATSFFKNYDYYQFSIVTNRFTPFILFLFWFFFNFIGELLIFIIFDFSTTIDSIFANNFVFFKNTTVFNTTLYVQKLHTALLFIIFFFSFSALLFLNSLRFHSYTKYLNFNFIIIIFVSLFFSYYFLWVALYCLIKNLIEQ